MKSQFVGRWISCMVALFVVNMIIPAEAQVPYPVIPPITHTITPPPGCDGGYTDGPRSPSVAFGVDDALFDAIITLVPAATAVVLFDDFTERNFFGFGNGPRPGNNVAWDATAGEYTFTTTSCCHEDDTVGYIVDLLEGADVVRYFGTIIYRQAQIDAVARDDSYSTDESTPLTVAAPGVLANDDLDPCLPVTLTKVPGSLTSGAVTLDNDGSFVFTPVDDFCGVVTFEYTITQGTFTSPPATVTITVNAVNNYPPVVIDHCPGFTTAQNITGQPTITLDVPAPGVLTGAFDPDHPCPVTTLTARLISGPSNGTVVLNPDGSFTYTPNDGFCGDDSFTYVANDGDFDSNIGEVCITVVADNACPEENDNVPYLTLTVTKSEYDELLSDTSPQTWNIPRDSDAYATMTADQQMFVDLAQGFLMDRIIDPDTDNPFGCGNTNVYWSLNTAFANPSDIIAAVEGDDFLRITWTWAALLQNYDPGVVFSCEPCDETDSTIVEYRVFQDNPDGTTCVLTLPILITFISDDSPPVAEPVMWPPSGTDHPLLVQWLTTRYPAIGWTDECLVLEDSVDNLIPLPALLIPAYQNNPDNCCGQWGVEDVGCCPQVVCIETDPANQYTEQLIVDFWPEEDFDLDIDGIGVVSFAGTERGDEITTYRGGTATLDGSYIRYTPPADWPLCEFEYDYIPYMIRQTTEYECGTTDQPTAISYIQVRVCGVCDDPVAQDDHVIVCQDTDAVILMADLIANDFDVDFASPNMVAFSGADPIVGIAFPAFSEDDYRGIPDTFEGFALHALDQELLAAIADGTDISVIEGGNCVMGDIGLSVPVTKDSRSSWGWPADSPVVEVVGDLTMFMPPNVTAFYFGLDGFNGTVTAVANDGTEVSMADIYVGHIGFHAGEPGKTIMEIRITNNDNGSYLGDFAVSMSPVAYVCGIGLEVFPLNGELIINEVVTDIGAIPVSLTYRPRPGFLGSDSFSYNVCLFKDCGGQGIEIFSATATVHIEVLPDGEPIANAVWIDDPDAFITQDEMLIISADALLANDHPAAWLNVVDYDDSMSAGSVAWDAAAQTFEYTPAADFAGWDVFWYQVALSDEVMLTCGSERTDWAMVYVYVLPKANDDLFEATFSAGQTVIVAGNVLDNDVLPAGWSSVVTIMRPAASAHNPGHGSLVLNQDGSFTYTMNPGNPTLMDGFAYYLLTDVFDGNGDFIASVQSELAFVTLDFGWENTDPIAHHKTIIMNMMNQADGIVSATDPDLGWYGFGGIDFFTLQDAPQNGAVEFNQQTGAFTYTVDEDFRRDGSCEVAGGVDTFTFTATDIHGGVSAMATVTLRMVCNTPPVAHSQNIELTMNESKSGVLLATDPDMAAYGVGGIAEFILETPMPGDAVVELVDPSAGTFTVTPNMDVYTHGGCNPVGGISFTFRAVDVLGAISAPATVSVRVNWVNRQPTAVSQAGETESGVPLAFTLAGADPDTCQELSYRIVAGPQYGSIERNGDVITYTSNPGVHGVTDVIRYVANDGLVDSAEATIAITVIEREVTDRMFTFEWPVINGADWYRLHIERDGVAMFSRWVYGNSFVHPRPLRGGVYRWWVQPRNSLEWYYAGEMFIQSAEPGPVELIGPRGSQYAETLTYEWVKDMRATRYHFVVQRNGRTIRSVSLDLEGEGVASQEITAHRPGHYRWGVRASGPEGVAAWSIAEFTILPDPIAPVGGQMTHGLAEFSWNSVPGADRYRVVVRRLGGSSGLVIDQVVHGDTMLQAASALPMGSYIWRVGAWNSATGLVWSDIESFEVGFDPVD